MATAADYINFTNFNVVASPDPGTISDSFATADMDGELIYYNWDMDYTNALRDEGQNYTQTYNFYGPDVLIYNVGGPNLYYEIGWAIYAFGGDDIVVGYTLEDWLVGAGGNDLLKGEGSRDILHGETGNDTLYGGDDDDWVYGGADNDNVYGGDGDDWMHGGSGNDWMNGDQGADTLSGGLGNDSYRIAAGDLDTVVENANEGSDWIYLSASSYTLGLNVENLVVDAGIVTATNVNGNALANTIRMAGGNDRVWALGGSDVIEGNGGNDTISAGSGNDKVYGGAGADKITGEGGNDYIDGGAGTDSMDGGLGDDTFVVEDTTDVVTEALDGGIDTVQSLLATTTLGANVENLKMLFAGYAEGTGNALNNRLEGSVWANLLNGLDGADTIEAGIGNDTAYGGTGNDMINGDIGDDRVWGDDGDDLVKGGAGSDFAYGGNGNDTVQGNDGVDFVYGGAGDDQVYGSGGATNLADTDYVYGDAGNDTVWGDAGNDVVRGGDGNDAVHGGDGNDNVYGDAGIDLLYGEAGADKFIFRSLSDAPMSGLDRVMDFVAGVDKIDLSNIDANSTTGATNDAFHFNAVKPFFASAGDLNISTNLLGTVVEGDVNGDGVSDFRILVVGDYAMTAADFIL